MTPRPAVRTLLIGVLVLAVVVVGLVLLDVGHRSRNGAQPSPGATAAGRSPSAAVDGTAVAGGTVGGGTAGVKRVIQGLVDRQGEPRKGVLSDVHAYVVKTSWADLQKAAGGPITGDNAIDRAIARVRQPDFARAGVVLKLRVFAGIDAPVWAKSLGGAPIAYVNNQEGGSVSGGTIGRFWTPAFEAAYADLQARLAAKYDNVPQIREITVSGCSTIFDEPFVRQVGSAGNVAGLESAGYTIAADENCIRQAIDAHEVWRHTTSDLDFAPFPLITQPGGNRDLAFTLSMMSFCRQQLGLRCGLQNNALSTDKLATPQFAQMYARMVALGPPLIFQTAASKRLGDPQQVLDAAVRMKANSLELPQGYPSWPAGELAAAAKGLAANPLP